MLAIAYVAGALVWIATSDGLTDRNGEPLGADFSSYYATSTLTLAGQPEAPFDLAKHHAAEIAVFDRADTPTFGWFYPPFFLLLVAPLALVSYPVALLLWLASTFTLYLRTAWAILPRRETVLVAAAFRGRSSTSRMARTGS